MTNDLTRHHMGGTSQIHESDGFGGRYQLKVMNSADFDHSVTETAGLPKKHANKKMAIRKFVAGLLVCKKNKGLFFLNLSRFIQLV